MNMHLAKVGPTSDWDGVSPAVPVDPMVSMIERMATDPAADIDKLDRLLQMKERMEAGADRKAFFAAMADCQAEMPAIVARSNNDQTRSKYAKLSAIYAEAKPVISSHGFSFSTWPAESKTPGHLAVKWVVRHRDGHSEEGIAEIPLDDKGIKGSTNKTGTHAFGSSNSYARRYVFCMVFDIAIATEDDDGNRGGGRPVTLITSEQYIEIRDLAEQAGVTFAQICTGAGISDLHELPVSKFQTVINKLNATMKAEEAANAKADESLIADLSENVQ